nr:EAL domain-containing protein [Schlegelella koreensis]
MPWGVLTTAADGRVLSLNRRFAEWCAAPADQVVGRRLKELLAPASRILFETHVVPMLEVQGFAHEIALDLAGAPGKRVPLLVSAIRRAGAISITAFDASEIRRHERELKAARRSAEDAAAELARSNERLRARSDELLLTLESIADAVITTDRDGNVTSMNPAAEALVGRSRADLVGAPIAGLGEIRTDTDPPQPLTWNPTRDEPVRSERPIALWRHDGVRRLVSASMAPLRDASGAMIGAVWVGRDVTDEQMSARRRAYEAVHDRLTGLFNRAELERRAQELVEVQGERAGVLCHLDVDQFRVLNNTLGNRAGDSLLVQVAEVLRGSLRHSDIVARVSGDEFAIVLAGCGRDDALRLAATLCQALAEHRFEWQGQAQRLTASAGLAPLSPADPLATVMATAHVACGAAKEAGGNRAKWSGRDDAVVQQRRGEMGWVARIQDAIAERRFVLFFQPIVPLVDSAAPHGEILLRLRDEQGRLLGPGEFIPAAERYRRMQDIDRYVVEHTLAWLAATPEVEVSINVSGQSFGDPGFSAHVAACLASTGVDARRICFELTETAAMGDLQAALTFIATMKARGARFALDDFGVGLSSFTYLQKLPVDVLKIDGSFVRDLVADPVSRAIVESIRRIATLCGLRTVGEWVEDAATLAALREIGVDAAQGYGVGKPVPVAAWRDSLRPHAAPLTAG